MTSKKIVKLAMIRKNDASPCPFGLSIPFGCRSAGKLVDKMAPISVLGEDASDEEKAKIIKANKRLLNWKLVDSAEKPSQCKYAASIIEDKNAVECNVGDAAGGVPAPFAGVPFYSNTPGLDGVYTYPIGYYADFNTSRNLFYGIFSLQGSFTGHMINKVAQQVETAEGACILVTCEDGTVLLIKRSAESSYPGTWGLPGGHLEAGETVSIGAAREFYEEMGFIPEIEDMEQLDILDKGSCIVFVTKVNKDVKDRWLNLINLNDEHDEYKWFKINEIPNELHPVAQFALEKTTNILE